jgi:hypothetical protein
MRVSNNKKKKTKKDVDHVGFRNGVLFCFHCGGSQSLPMKVDAFTEILDSFSKIHKKCLKTWKQPEPDMNLSRRERILWWIKEGEQGMSSKALCRLLTPDWPMEWNERLKINGFVPPLDPDDFRRCYLLIKAVPELKKNFHLLRLVDPPHWANIVDNWDQLCAMLKEQMATGKPNGMYEYMQGFKF